MIPLGSLGGFHEARMNCPNGYNLTSDGGPGSKKCRRLALVQGVEETVVS